MENTGYLVTYRDHKDDSIVELKVKSIGDSSLGLSFICVSDFLFETSSVLIRPEEESLKKRFENIHSLHLSIYSVISIAEVGLETPTLRFKNDKSNLVILQNNSTPDRPN